MNKNQFKQLLGAVGLTLIVSIILTLFIAMPRMIPSLARQLAPQTKGLTELYLNDHLDLPKDASPGSEIAFSYTIHNVEHKPMTYPIDIFIQDDANPPETSLVASDSATLNDNETRTLTGQFIFPTMDTARSKIIVKLENLNQSVDFWTYEPPYATLSAQVMPETK